MAVTRREMIRRLGDEVSAPSVPVDYTVAERAYNAIVMAGAALDSLRDAFYQTWSSDTDRRALCSDVLHVSVAPAGEGGGDDRRFSVEARDVLGARQWSVSRSLEEFRALRAALSRTAGLGDLIEAMAFPKTASLVSRPSLLRRTVSDSTHAQLGNFLQQMVHVLFFLGNPFFNASVLLAEFLRVEENAPRPILLEALTGRVPVATQPHPHLPSKIMMAALMSSAAGLLALRRFVEGEGEPAAGDLALLAFCSDFCEFFPHPHTQYSARQLTTRQVEELDLLWRTYLAPGAEQSLREHALAFRPPDAEAADRFTAVLQFEMETEQVLARLYLVRFLISPAHAEYAAEQHGADGGALAPARLAPPGVGGGSTSGAGASAGDGDGEEDLMVELVAHVL